MKKSLYEEIDSLLELDLNRRYKVLDIGCGRGELPGCLSDSMESGSTLVGIDEIEDSISSAKQNYPHVDFRREKFIDSHGFEGNSFDIVTSVDAMECIPNKVVLLDEVFRALGLADVVVEGAGLDQHGIEIDVFGRGFRQGCYHQRVMVGPRCLHGHLPEDGKVGVCELHKLALCCDIEEVFVPRQKNECECGTQQSSQKAHKQFAGDQVERPQSFSYQVERDDDEGIDGGYKKEYCFKHRDPVMFPVILDPIDGRESTDQAED